MDLEALPEKTGVYILKGERGEVLYVGKAKNIKKRIKQHISSSKKDAKEKLLMERTKDVEVILTKNEYESLILEMDLIRIYKPKFNVIHKFSGDYAYLLLTEEEFPQLRIVREREKGKIFGPFLSLKRAKRLKALIHKVFKIRTCEVMPKDSKPCIDYHLGLCSAPCANLVSREEYQLQVKGALSFLSGDVSGVLPELYQKIEEYSKKLMFERCIEIREQIKVLEERAKGQGVSNLEEEEGDLFYLEGDNLLLVIIRNHRVVDKEIFKVKEPNAFLVEYYYNLSYLPKKIFTNFKVEETVREFLRNRAKRELEFKGIPKVLKGFIEENLSLNSYEEFCKSFERVFNFKAPKIIEGFDISHFFGENSVGSCVVWERGRMVKGRYRRYRIRTVSGIDDYSCLFEVLSRRAKRILEGKEEEPSLWLIDGGKGQLKVGLEVKRKFNLKLKVFSLAKGEEILYTEEGSALPLKEYPTLYRVFTQIRDEAHRFANTYNRLLRKKELIGDVLKELGLPKSYRDMVYRNFENLYEFINSDEETLRKLGIPISLKERVKRYLDG